MPHRLFRPMRQTVAETAKRRLPHVAGVGADHLLAGLAAKGLGEVSTVLYRAVGPVLPRRVRVSLDQQARAFRRRVLTPDLGKTDKEALLRGVAVFQLRGFGVFSHGFA